MKALFIGPKFYGYELEICKKLQDRGYEVDFYPERNDKLNSFVHFVGKFFNKAIKLHRLYEVIIKRHIGDKKYDLFLLIRGENISCKFINDLISNSIDLNGTTVYYTWDSINNLTNAKNIYHLFQRSYTFDFYDSEKLKGLGFLPLFYIDSYKNLSGIDEVEWDISIIASYSDERYEYVKSFVDNGYKVFHNLYLKPYLYFKQMLFNPAFRKRNKEFISTRSLSVDEIKHVYSRTKAVLDIPNTKQTGLSLRTFECLGCSKKMITTNKDVVKYDFFNKDNIFLLNAYNMSDINEWLTKEYRILKYEIVRNYNIDTWLDKLIFGNGVNE